MNLLAFSLTGAVISLLMMIAGFLWLGIRSELEVARMDPDQAADFVARGLRGHAVRIWFRGLASGVSLSAEKSTREIIGLLAAGRWSEGLPWAILALGALLALFFWPLLIGLFLGFRGMLLWGMAAFFLIGGLYAAWPRNPH